MGVGGSWRGPSKVQALWVKVRGPASRKEGPRSTPLRDSGVESSPAGHLERFLEGGRSLVSSPSTPRTPGVLPRWSGHNASSRAPCTLPAPPAHPPFHLTDASASGQGLGSPRSQAGPACAHLSVSVEPGLAAHLCPPTPVPPPLPSRSGSPLLGVISGSQHMRVKPPAGSTLLGLALPSAPISWVGMAPHSPSTWLVIWVYANCTSLTCFLCGIPEGFVCRKGFPPWVSEVDCVGT